MTIVVVDASIVIAGSLRDENRDDRALAFRVFEQIRQGSGLAPSQWWAEIANTLVVALRRNRLQAEEIAPILDDVAALAVTCEPASLRATLAATTLAQRHGLTVYDAAYLELALRTKATLASLDRAMLRAAADEGVAVFA
ncbi:type II toxin-antitoxin system VapC family toxin [Methyloraptor flagellatus]|uniref:Ribonuclease VapC n=1 Tax=Methyloraptor flagellatus TaxID=3162530 RepID=A0AAU7XCB6_9HYPH